MHKFNFGTQMNLIENELYFFCKKVFKSHLIYDNQLRKLILPEIEAFSIREIL